MRVFFETAFLSKNLEPPTTGQELRKREMTQKSA
jgi:hypothetical protein